MSAPVSHFITAPDGLKLHVLHYRPARATGLPLVCLPGLTRTCADFDTLASHLSSDETPPRDIFAMDLRGRGRSEYDRDPNNYNVAVELGDILAVLTGLEIGPAIFVGTSRGGILAMMLASARPAAIAGVVLNDIGPVIDMRGLVRIKSYVGKMPQPKDFREAADLLRRLFGTHFPKLSPDDWLAFARRSFKEDDGGLVSTYDPKLSKGLESVNLEKPLTALWKDFDALASVPVMVIRGANSDVLSASTVADMVARRPDIDTVEVPDQGHAPLLAEDDVIRRIGAFVVRCETVVEAKTPGGNRRGL